MNRGNAVGFYMQDIKKKERNAVTSSPTWKVEERYLEHNFWFEVMQITNLQCEIRLNLNESTYKALLVLLRVCLNTFVFFYLDNGQMFVGFCSGSDEQRTISASEISPVWGQEHTVLKQPSHTLRQEKLLYDYPWYHSTGRHDTFIKAADSG